MFLEIIFLVLFILVVWYFRLNNPINGFPPGPTRLPVVGNIFQLAMLQRGCTPYQMFAKITKKYGSLSFLQLGALYQVLTEDSKYIKEVLSSDVWVDRYYDKFVADRAFGKTLGLIWIGGDVWKEMRRFSVRTLRDFGFGKQKSMEATMQEELKDLMDNLNKSIDDGNNIICMKQFFTVAVLNTLWNMIAGFRFSHDDAKMQQLIEKIDQVTKLYSIGGSRATLNAAFPVLYRILPKNQQRTEYQAAMQNFFRNFLQERRAENHYKTEQRDFIDVFLTEIDKHKGMTSESNYYTDEQFIIVAQDLFLGGSETTSNTLEFAMLYMLLNPEVQTKVQQEIDSVVGRNRFPTFDDKAKMPYTEATLLEVQRLANVVPTIIRSPTQDTTLGQYQIPKGTIGILNTHGMHMNEIMWPNPHVFRPERFLDADMNVVNATNILPFGAGKRVCLGEVLARASLFTYFTGFLQNFTLQKSPNHSPQLSTVPEVGITLSPKPYHALIQHR